MTTDPIKALVDLGPALQRLMSAATATPWGNRGKLSDRIVGPDEKTIAEFVSQALGKNGDEQDEANAVFCTFIVNNTQTILAAIEALTPIAAGGRVMGEIEAEALRLEKEAVNLPFEIEKWLMTIKAHCTVIADPGPDDNVRDLAHHIKINVDGDLRSALHTALTASPSASTGKDEAVERVARAICRENCAFIGEKPCFEVEGAWPNPNCQEPGCHAQAAAALAAINGEK